MNIFMLLLLVILFRYLNVAREGEFNRDYLSKENTAAVNGIFVLMVLFSHGAQYISLKGPYDQAYVALKVYLDQLVVSTFLFYSGYGMMESVKKKGYPYVRSVMTSRFWKLLFQFNVAVVLYLIVGYPMNMRFSPSRILLATIAWTSVGNSNWYIFAIFGLYILFFLSFFVLKYRNRTTTLYVGAAVLTVLSAAFVLWQIRMGRPNYCYNTIILFSGGVWWSLLKKWIDQIVMRNEMVYFGIATVVAGIYCVSYVKRWNYGVEGYTVWATAFIMVLMLITMKVSLNNPVFSWFGNHVFSIYILQRIPMSILHYWGVSEKHKYVFLILSILSTMVIALIFEQAVDTMVSGWCRVKGRLRPKQLAE